MYIYNFDFVCSDAINVRRSCSPLSHTHMHGDFIQLDIVWPPNTTIQIASTHQPHIYGDFHSNMNATRDAQDETTRMQTFYFMSQGLATCIYFWSLTVFQPYEHMQMCKRTIISAWEIVPIHIFCDSFAFIARKIESMLNTIKTIATINMVEQTSETHRHEDILRTMHSHTRLHPYKTRINLNFVEFVQQEKRTYTISVI